MRSIGLTLLLLIVGAVAFIAYALLTEGVAKISDDNIVLLSEKPSPDGRHVIVEYQVDNGGMGSSRPYWAVVPPSYGQLNLLDYDLPESYRPAAWRDTGELVVEEFRASRDSDPGQPLKTGDSLHGVRIQVVSSLPASQSAVW